MDVKNQGRSVVPCAALKPLIEDWLDRWGYNKECRQGDTQLTSGYDALVFQSGVPRRRIWQIMKAEGNTSFDTADKLLTAMHMVSAWHVELAEYYQDPLEVATYERHLVGNGLEAA